MSISIGAGQVSARLLMAVIGLPYSANWLNDAQSDTFINSDPQAFQVYTVVIDTATNSATYTFTIDGTVITYTADSSTSNAEIGAGLLAAVNAAPHARGLFTPSFDTATLTLTANNIATDVVVSDSDAKLTTTETQAPAEADAAAFGRAIVDLGSSNDEGTLTGCVVYAAKLQAQVNTITLTQVSSESYGVTITINGQTRAVFVATAGSLALTTTALVTAINNAMDFTTAGTTVLAASSVAGTITLTAEVKGTPFTVGVSSISGLPGTISVANTTVGPLTDVSRWFAGISVASNDTEVTVVDGDEAKYAPNSGMVVLQHGRIWVQSDESPTPSNSVYVETLAGATAGRLYTTGSTTRVLLPQARWDVTPSRAAADGLALLNLL